MKPGNKIYEALEGGVISSSLFAFSCSQTCSYILAPARITSLFASHFSLSEIQTRHWDFWEKRTQPALHLLQDPAFSPGLLRRHQLLKMWNAKTAGESTGTQGRLLYEWLVTSLKTAPRVSAHLIPCPAWRKCQSL